MASTCKDVVASGRQGRLTWSLGSFRCCRAWWCSRSLRCMPGCSSAPRPSSRPSAVRACCSRTGTWPSCAARAARSVTRFPGCSDVFPQPTRMRPRLVPAELLRRTGKHTGTAAGHAGRSVLSPARRAGAHRRDRPPPARLPSDRAGHPAGRTTRRTAPGHGQARPAAMAPGPRSDPYGPGRPRRPGARGGSGTELDGVFAPLRQPPPTSATRRSSHEPPPGTSARQPPPGSPWPD